jgi:hypothetical protein
LGADQRQTKEGQTRNYAVEHTSKEAIQAMGLVARFANRHFITGQQANVVWPIQMVAKEDLKQGRPGQGRVEKALHREITPTLTGPARDAEHGDPTGHGQDGRDDGTELASRGCCHERVNAL